MSKAQRELSARGVPQGLIEVLISSSESCSIRYFIVDNSGSMASRDGKRLSLGGDGSMRTTSCTRWEELADSLKWHGQTAITLNAHTEFHLINIPGNSSPQKVVLGSKSSQHGMADLNAMISSGPRGATPLCATINKIVAEIKAMETDLRSRNKTVSLTIATDGASTDGDVVQALAPLIQLPCSVVVRLCTDDSTIVNYWNNIDNNLEIELDVLDDMEGEAKEVCSNNSWLAYTEVLHRVREWGNAPKVFDLLDERQLSLSEMQQIIGFVLGSNVVAGLPNFQDNEVGYREGLTAILTDYEQVHDAYTGRRVPMINPALITQNGDAQIMRQLQRGDSLTSFFSNRVITMAFILFVALYIIAF